MIGFRICTDLPRPDPDLVKQFEGAASSNLADAMGRFNFMDAGIKSRSGLSLCGVAVTVNCRPGDNLMVHKALEIAEAGDIVVVNTNGNVSSSVFGELMCHTAVAAKLGGIVVDGAIRDVPAIMKLSFAAFSRVVSPGGCDKDGPGEINVDIACGGAVVHPGDIIVGDGDGVVVVPQRDAAETLQRVGELVAREQERIKEIRGGVVFKPAIDDALRAKGVIE
ncbi:MAG: RraA family protein [Gemmatimonadetes bacterium]|nr:RraA family protein [Gemmatimonadota bacterium]